MYLFIYLSINLLIYLYFRGSNAAGWGTANFTVTVVKRYLTIIYQLILKFIIFDNFSSEIGAFNPLLMGS